MIGEVAVAPETKVKKWGLGFMGKIVTKRKEVSTS